MVVSTYQAASGAGAAAMEELELQTREVLEVNEPTCKIYSQQYAFNLLSHNVHVTSNGYNEEEMKLIKETRKIWVSNTKIKKAGELFDKLSVQEMVQAKEEHNWTSFHKRIVGFLVETFGAGFAMEIKFLVSSRQESYGFTTDLWKIHMGVYEKLKHAGVRSGVIYNSLYRISPRGMGNVNWTISIIVLIAYILLKVLGAKKRKIFVLRGIYKGDALYMKSVGMEGVHTLLKVVIQMVIMQPKWSTTLFDNP